MHVFSALTVYVLSQHWFPKKVAFETNMHNIL